MGFRITDFVTLIFRGILCFIYAMTTVWKFSIVFLGIMPFMAIFVVILVTRIKKFTVIELKAYGSAGKIAQEVLSSLRTVLSFGLMKNEIAKYGENLAEAENMSTRKGMPLSIAFTTKY